MFIIFQTLGQAAFYFPTYRIHSDFFALVLGTSLAFEISATSLRASLFGEQLGFAVSDIELFGRSVDCHELDSVFALDRAMREEQIKLRA